LKQNSITRTSGEHLFIKENGVREVLESRAHKIGIVLFEVHDEKWGFFFQLLTNSPSIILCGALGFSLL
jgi:hypothetical protein